MTKLYIEVSPYINAVLKPFGLILWADWNIVGNKIELAGVTLGRRPRGLID